MKNVLEYLEASAQKFPDNIAIEDENGFYTFYELREKALALANCISTKLNGKTKQPIMIYMSKGINSIVAMLGIVYSGNFYTPTDVRFSFKKTQEIMDCLKPILIISEEREHTKLCENGVTKEQIILFDEISLFESKIDSFQLLKRSLDIDPVYIFFTSGSTGAPKGVIITHRNIIDYIEWAVPYFGICEKTIMGNQSPFYFDISTQDVYATLKAAAKLIIIPETYFAFPIQALQFIKNRNINYLYWVPSAFINVCSRNALDKVDISCVKQIVFGGEVLPVKYLNMWKKAIPHLQATNVYGPTEATVNVTAFRVNREFSEDEQLPLGAGLDNTELIILSENNEIINDINVKGELCVRGSCLSPGYWNDLQKTNEVFTQSVYSYIPEKMYHTGDMVHYNSQNELVFDGRIDFQIKHLGYRIELAEIERAALSICEMVAAVSDYDYEKKQIVLFYISEGLEYIDLQRKLTMILPKYMVPTIYYKLKKMPYNENGKIDRRFLRKTYME